MLVARHASSPPEHHFCTEGGRAERPGFLRRSRGRPEAGGHRGAARSVRGGAGRCCRGNACPGLGPGVRLQRRLLIPDRGGRSRPLAGAHALSEDANEGNPESNRRGGQANGESRRNSCSLPVCRGVQGAPRPGRRTSLWGTVTNRHVFPSRTSLLCHGRLQASPGSGPTLPFLGIILSVRRLPVPPDACPCR